MSIGIRQLKAEVKEYGDERQKDNNTAQLSAFILRIPGDVDGSGFVDSDELKIIEREKGKLVLASSCGYACDLNGDGRINKLDEELLSLLCGAQNCANGSDKPKPTSIEAIQQLDHKELRMVQALKPADWEAAFEEADEQMFPRAQPMYLRALQRLSETVPVGRLAVK